MLTNEQTDLAYRILAYLESTANLPRHLEFVLTRACVDPIPVADSEIALDRLAEKEFVTVDGDTIQITELGRLYAQRMRKAVHNLLDFEWAERLPRALARESLPAYQITDFPKP